MKVQARQIDRVFSKRFLDSLLEERSVSRETQSEANELGECMEEIVDSIEPQYNDQGVAVVDGTNDTEAYANELYSELNMRKPENYLDVLSQCNGYLSYKNLEIYYNRIKGVKDDELVKKTLEDYGYSVGYFLKNAEFAVKNFSRRIGRALSLWIDENRSSSSTIY